MDKFSLKNSRQINFTSGQIFHDFEQKNTKMNNIKINIKMNGFSDISAITIVVLMNKN